jgi:hypothetical protein
LIMSKSDNEQQFMSLLHEHGVLESMRRIIEGNR